VPYWEIASGRPGPRLLVTCAMHGNEVQGAAITGQFVPYAARHLRRGSLMMAPMTNLIAIRERQPHIDNELGRYYGRDQVDNLNCTWPGKADGSDAQRLSYALFNSVVSEADVLLDLHCWYGNNAAAALARTGHELSLKLARATALRFARHSEWKPEVKERPVYPCSLSSYFNDIRRAGVCIEFSGQYTFRPEEIKRGLRAIKNFCRVLDMLPGKLEGVDEEMVWLNTAKETVVKAPCGGLFIQSGAKLADPVTEGQLLGQILVDRDLHTEEIRSPVSGYLFKHGRMGLTTGDLDPLMAWHPYAREGDELAVIMVPGESL
jgi:hypothetical protein